MAETPRTITLPYGLGLSVTYTRPPTPAWEAPSVDAAPGLCSCCGGPVPEPGLWLVPTPNGPRDACDQDCAHALDRRTR